jgi:phosphoserine phosphatase RsbU/P
MLRLYVEPAQGEPFEFSLQGEEVVIGRSSTCQLTIHDRFMSRRHARLRSQGGEWWLEDLGSRNGTLVDGEPITEPRPIAAGDRISLSSSVIRVEDGTERRPAPGTSTGFGDHTIFREASQVLRSQASMPPESADSVEMLHSYAERMQVLNDVHQALARSLSVEDLLETLLGRAFELLRPEEGIVVLRQADGSFARAARRAAPGYEEERLLSDTLVHEVADKGLAALVLDVSADERFAEAESIVASGVRSLIAAPLADADGSLGMIALNSRLHRHQFTEADMELLTSLGAVAALRLRNLALAQGAAARQRELEVAREIQVSLLPDRLPDLPGFEIHGGTAPSQGVSGDFYEMVRRDGECVFVIADVSGKGISASLLTASLEALLAGQLEVGGGPAAICRQVSQRLYLRTPPAKYATAVLASLDPVTGRLLYCNAGHNPPLVFRAAGGCERLDGCGPPLGLFPDSTYEEREVTLAPGELLVLYTDGITEAEDADAREFGIERLIEVFAGQDGKPYSQLIDSLRYVLGQFVGDVPFADDRTLVLLRRLAP